MSRQTTTEREVTLSVAVTAHGEGRLLRPTLRSVAAALDAVLEQGITCELLIMLDNPSDATAREADRWTDPTRLGAPIRIVRSSFGDPALSRNAAAATARGRYLAFCDGDDLVSRNYFTVALELLTASDGPLIVHPGVVISFGARTARWVIPGTESVDHLDLIRHNLWPSSSVSQRETYLTYPYVEMPPGTGYGPEDWLWNIETSIARIPHRPAPDTVFFYRVRETGGVNNRHTNSILPPFDLTALREALPAQQPVEDPAAGLRPTPRDRMRRLMRGGYRRARPLVRVATFWMSRRMRERLYTRGREVYNRFDPNYRKPEPLVVSPSLQRALLEATELEPAISWTASGILEVPEWIPVRDVYAPILLSLVDELRDHADALVAVPWVGIGGADLVSLNYARALAGSERFGEKVAMLATYLPERTLRHLIPPEVTFVQVPPAWRDLHPDLQRRLLAQVLLFVAPQLVVSVNCFDITNSLQLYSRPMGATSRIFLTLFAFDRIGAGYPTNPITDDSQRTYLDEIRAILTDNVVTREIIRETLALDDDRVMVHHQPALESTPQLRRDTRAFQDSSFDDDNPFLLLWPHRLDKEKRPETLVAIAERLREERIPARIHIYGQQVLSDNGDALMSTLEKAGVEYRGPYSGGLPALATEDYHAMLLTSESEGLPLVLVQSMLLGLPVIATAVGGVPSIVRDDETGFLTHGPDDIEGFVAAIRRLMDSRDERRRIIETAYDFAAQQHGWEAFVHAVDETLR